MDIVHINEAFGGGAARHVIDLASAQVRHHHRVRVIYCPSQVDLQAETLMRATPGITWLPVRMAKGPSARDVLIISRIIGLIRESGRPQLIHCHCNKAGLMGTVIATCLRVPFIYTPHAFYSMQPRLSRPLRAVTLAVERLLSRRADTTMLLSRKEADFVTLNGFNGGRFRISTNGVTAYSVEHSAALREGRQRHAGGPLVIGFLGRLSYQKGVDILLAAIRASAGRDYHVEIHGFGPVEPLVRSAVRDFPERISFHGPSNGPQVMSRFDVLVMPSRYEGFPYVLLEAVAHGLPIITTDVGGVDEMVAHEWNGVVLRGEPIAALTEVFDHITSRDWQRLGLHSLLLSGRNTIAGMYQRIMDAYEEILATRGK
jgi:glycosyltransferase involved in cell wall biosynthesis